MLMNQIELEPYIESVMRRYDNFEIQRRPFNIKCKCHICGDSKRDASQARLNAYYYDGSLMLNCYNCGSSYNAISYLKLFHPYEYGLYQDKVREQKVRRFKRKVELEEREEEEKYNSLFTTFEEALEEEKKVEYPKELPYCYCLTDIVEEHPIIQYVKGRMIPRDKWHRLFFTTEFKKLANYACPGTYSKEEPEPRLVIPIYNEDGYIESFQGRSLREGKYVVRYVTIKFDESATKIYGLDTVDESEVAFFLEGQLDSLFIDNGLAITGGNISIRELNKYYPYERAFILDNEPRHQDTINRIEKLINSGESIVLFDRVNWEGKDINQFIQNGVTIEEINSYIRENVLTGLEARLRFMAWKQVDTDIIRRERRNNYRQEQRKKGVDRFFDMVRNKKCS